MANQKGLSRRLLDLRRFPLTKKIAFQLLMLFGISIPNSVEIGEDFYLVHGGLGVVIHPKTVIGDRVIMHPGVTLGRADIHIPFDKSSFEGIVIEDDVILGSGAKVLCKNGVLTIRKGTIVGANAVLLNSTQENEIWAGVPAKLVGYREKLYQL